MRAFLRFSLAAVFALVSTGAGASLHAPVARDAQSIAIPLDGATHEPYSSSQTDDYVYDAVGNVTQVIVPRHVNGAAQDVTTQVAYDLLNRATIVTEALGTADERKSEYAYDAMDNRHQVQNPRGVLSQAAYDALDRLRTLTEAAGTNVARSATYDYDLVDNLRLQTDARGTVTETKYDAHYRPVEVIDAQNRSEQRSTRYAYDPADNLIATTDPNGNTTNLTPDPLNRPILITYPPAGAGNNIVSREYDEEDNLTQETDEADQVTRYPLYDPENRLKKVCNPADQCTSFDYDQNGNRTRKELPAGNEWSYGYDVFNRLASVTTAAGTTSYAYEPGDGLEQVTDAKQKQVEYHYDAVGRVTALIQKKNGGDLTTHYSYQDKINRTGLKDPLGHEISYRYDPLDRMERADYPTASHAGVRLNRIAYAYDPNNNLTGATESKSGGTSAEDATTQAYDFLNRLSSSVQRGRTVSYAYDPADNLASVSSPGGTTHYAYNARNWMTGISPSPLAGEGGGATTYAYYPDGKIQSITRANGTVTEYGYDEADRITGIQHRRGASTFLSLAYGYDANGNRDTETETGEAGTRSLDYDYDAADRLTDLEDQDSTAPGPRATQYGLDEVGNRSTERITETVLDAQGQPVTRTINRSYSYDDTHWLTQIDSDHPDDPDQSFTYDANGNTTRITRTTGTAVVEDVLDYDLRDRLVKSARGPPGQLQTTGSYDYDYRNLRIRHADPTRGNIETLYDGSRVLEETQNGFAYTRYRHGLGLDALETAGTTHYVHADSLGTTRILTQASGATQARYRLDSWGRVTKTEGESPNRQLFTGQEYDPATGLHYFGARYYDPATGRFITQDSYLGEPGDPRSLHRYEYAYANPLSYADPDGHVANLVTGGIGAVVGGVGGCALGAWHGGWSGCGKGAAIGAVAGGAAGLTFGASLAITGAAGIGGTAVAGTTATTGSALIATTTAGAVGAYTGVTANALSQGQSFQDANAQGLMAGTIGATAAVGGYAIGGGTVAAVGTGALARTAGAVAGGSGGDLLFQGGMIAAGMQDGIDPAQVVLGALVTAAVVNTLHITAESPSGAGVTENGPARAVAAKPAIADELARRIELNPDNDFGVTGAASRFDAASAAMRARVKANIAESASARSTSGFNATRMGAIAAKASGRTPAGPAVPAYHAKNFDRSTYTNRQVSGDEVFYKYHGVNNRTGKTHNYLTKRLYATETELRDDLAILGEWGITIDRVTTFQPARGTWISEGKAAGQVGYVTGEIRPGGGYQGLIGVDNLPNSSVIRTDLLPGSFKK